MPHACTAGGEEALTAKLQGQGSGYKLMRDPSVASSSNRGAGSGGGNSYSAYISLILSLVSAYKSCVASGSGGNCNCAFCIYI